MTEECSLDFLGGVSDYGLAESLEEPFKASHSLAKRTHFLIHVLAEPGDFLARSFSLSGEFPICLTAQHTEISANLRHCSLAVENQARQGDPDANNRNYLRSHGLDSVNRAVDTRFAHDIAQNSSTRSLWSI